MGNPQGEKMQGKAPRWCHSRDKGLRDEVVLVFVLKFVECPPHEALLIAMHTVNIIISINIHEPQGGRSETHLMLLIPNPSLKGLL
jgi:hypothetical protein